MGLFPILYILRDNLANSPAEWNSENMKIEGKKILRQI